MYIWRGRVGEGIGARIRRSCQGKRFLQQSSACISSNATDTASSPALGHPRYRTEGQPPFASSIIMSPAEAGIEGNPVPASETPDGRPGVIVQIFQRTGHEWKMQMLRRVGQCVLACPTTAAFDAMPDAKKQIRIGAAVRMFGDGFEKRDVLAVSWQRSLLRTCLKSC